MYEIKTKLKKEIGLLDLFCIASGAMISSGIFVLPGLAFALTGPSVFLSYMIAAVLAGLGMLSQAELISAMPKAGGTYFFVSRSFGPAMGTINGILTWFSLSLKSSFALIGMGAFISLIVPLNISIIALLLTILFMILNILGVKEASLLQVVSVIILLMLMSFYVVKGIPEIKISNFEPFAPGGLLKIVTTSGFVFVAFGGLIGVTSVAEEVKNAGKVVPVGMILSLTVVSLLYFLIILVTVGVVEPDKLASTLTPISDGGYAISGKLGYILMTSGAILAFSSTSNAGIMAASRLPLALGRDFLVPEFLGKVSRRFKTPVYSILITGLFIISVLFLKLEVLVKAASTVIIFSNIFASLSVIVMRESKIQNYRPVFKSPLYPWLQLAGIVGFGFLLLEMGLEAILISAGLIFLSLLIYFTYGRLKAKRDYALLYLIKRITSKELLTGDLERELKDIIQERENVKWDRFDRLISLCEILNIKEKIDVSELFRIVSDKLHRRIGVERDYIYQKLKEREKVSSTVINNFVAIPHIVVDGKKIFDILVVRAEKGVVFSSKYSDVRAIFVLIGTMDERNFHLKSLSSIVQIVYNPDFEKRWLEARSIENIRDVLLLSERKRTDQN